MCFSPENVIICLIGFDFTNNLRQRLEADLIGCYNDFLALLEVHVLERSVIVRGLAKQLSISILSVRVYIRDYRRAQNFLPVAFLNGPFLRVENFWVDY